MEESQIKDDVLHKNLCKNGWCSIWLIFTFCMQSCRGPCPVLSPGICNYWMTLQTSRHALSVFILWGLVGRCFCIATSNIGDYEHLATGNLKNWTDLSDLNMAPKSLQVKKKWKVFSRIPGHFRRPGTLSFWTRQLFRPWMSGKPKEATTRCPCVNKKRGKGFQRPHDSGIYAFLSYF